MVRHVGQAILLFFLLSISWQSVRAQPHVEEVRAIHVKGDNAYLVVDSAFVVLDVHDPTQPVEIERFPLGTGPARIREADNHLYVVQGELGKATSNHNFTIYDISQPSTPVVVFQDDYVLFDMVVVGEYAYATAGDRDPSYGVYGFDLSVPSQPVEQWYGFYYDFPKKIEAIGDTLYVIDVEGYTDDGNWAFYALDITDPLAPEQIVHFYPPRDVDDFAVHPEAAYLVTGTLLHVLDLSNLDEITATTLPRFMEHIRGIMRADDLLVLGVGASTQVFSLSDPLNPLSISTIERYGRTFFMDDDLLYVGGHGLSIYDLSNPANVAVLGDYATDREHLRESPEAAAMESSYPNPFTQQTTVRYTLAQAGPVSVRVYDVLGREVVTLLNAVQPLGTHELVWMGTDAQGQRVPSGVYYLRLASGKTVQTDMVTVVR